MLRVCAVIVTYNRKELLLKCLQALTKQSVKLSGIYIVDNASTDGTVSCLLKYWHQKEMVFADDAKLSLKVDDIEIELLRLDSNTGGAGGFYYGLKGARQLNKFDLFWLMDDDGFPAEDCLEKLLPYIEQHDYVMPVSVDIENYENLSWPVKLKDGRYTASYSDLRNSWGTVINFVYPFNGSLLSKKIVDQVGYPNKDLFIWGDEYEHYWRCKKLSYNPITITSAAFYHPANKLNFAPIWFGLYKVPVTDVDWRFICLVRNSTYIYWNHTNKLNILLKGIVYTYYLLAKKRDLKRYKLYLHSVKDGINGDFSRHWQYLKRK
jgi:rhamnopyranosyl-N-acetylglucosaminyl-diphospho-decaprenol beta-1,3/1,4-galactofuranosyltransferase